MTEIPLTRFWWLLLPVLLCMAQALPASGNEALLRSLKDAAARLRRLTLDNGTVCLIQEDHSAPVVAVQIWVRTGSIHEEDYLGGGMSHYIEHMLFKGTPTRKPGEIARQINQAGGQINAYTTLDRTVFHTDLPSRHWELGLQILSDAVRHASFPEEEYQREKDVILREMAMCRDDPDRVANELLWRTAFRVHPYRFPVIGHEEIFRGHTRDDLLGFFRRHYQPDNLIIVVAGDIKADGVEAALRAIAADFPRQSRSPVLLPAEPAQLAPRLHRQTGPYQISRLHMAWHTIPLAHPDAPALDLLSTIVGSGRSSRLNREIKEKRRLVHSIDAWSFTPAEPGLFGISAAFDPAREAEVLQAIEEEVSTWNAGAPSAAEMNKARTVVTAGELSGFQTMAGQAAKFAAGEFYAGDPAYSQLYLRRLFALKPRDLKTVAARYLRPENRTTVILAPSNAGPAAVSAAVAVAAPPVRRAALPGGVPLLLREDHRLPFVYLCAAFRGGLLAETEQNNGITRLMADLLVRGTAHRTADQVASEVESMGAELAPFSGHNSFGLQGRCLAPDLDRFLAIFADCLLNPAFPADEVAKQKTVQVAAQAEQEEHPFYLAQRNLQEMLFPGHPYRWDPLGTRAGVEALTPADLRAHHKALARGANMVLALFGDFDPRQVEKRAAAALRKLPREAAANPEPSLPAPALPALRERREPKEQTILLVGFPGVAVDDPRRDALTLLETAMSGLSSQLALEIRDKRGLAYYAGASQRPGLRTGLFMLYTGIRADALPDVRTLIAAEIDRVTRTGLTPEELDRARNQIVARHEMGLQDNSGLAMTCALDELYGLGFEHEFATQARMDALTVGTVREVAAAVLVTNRQAVSILLPEAPAPGGAGRP